MDELRALGGSLEIFGRRSSIHANTGDALLPPPCALEVRNAAVLLCQRQAYLELHLRTGWYTFRTARWTQQCSRTCKLAHGSTRRNMALQ